MDFISVWTRLYFSRHPLKDISKLRNVKQIKEDITNLNEVSFRFVFVYKVSLNYFVYGFVLFFGFL